MVDCRRCKPSGVFKTAKGGGGLEVLKTRAFEMGFPVIWALNLTGIGNAMAQVHHEKIHLGWKVGVPQPLAPISNLSYRKFLPEPSCSHTILPHCRQLFTSLCFCPKHSHGWRPGSRTLILASPSSLYSDTKCDDFFFVGDCYTNIV